MFIGAVKKIYPEVEKETVVIGKTAKSTKSTKSKRKPTIPKMVPHVKVRVSRGKNYDPNQKITSNQDAVDMFRKYLTKYQIEGQEQFLAMYLTQSNGVIGIYPHSKGGMTSTTADVSLIAGTALQLAAQGVITCHNHPAGSLKPSEGDLRVASKLQRVLSTHDIRLLDNIILTKTGSTSF